MLVQQIQYSQIPQIRPSRQAARPALKGLNCDTVSFSGKINQYLNKEVANQSAVFKGELISLFMSDKPVAENFKLLTNCLFRDFNFELKDINEVKYPDIKQKLPIVFAKPEFPQPQPLTKLYLNFDKIRKIREGAVNPFVHFEKFASEITDCVAEHNEFNLISNCADEFREKLASLDKIDLKSIDKSIKELIKKYNFDVDYKVVEKTDNLGVHYVKTKTTSDGDVFSEFTVDPKVGKENLVNELPHELVHLLNANSISTNKNFNSLFQVDEMKINRQLADCIKKMHVNLQTLKSMTTSDRKKIYDSWLAEIIKNNPSERKDLILLSLEKNSREEAFAYSKTKGIFQQYADNPQEIPVGAIYKDFLNYLLSVKYDSSKMAAF